MWVYVVYLPVKHLDTTNVWMVVSWVIVIILALFEWIVLVEYFTNNRGFHKVVLSFREFKYHRSLSPKKYRTSSYFCAYYYIDEKSPDYEVHTAIYFKSIWSQFRYNLYRIKSWYNKQKISKYNSNDRTRYFNAIYEDEVRRNT